MDIKSQSQLDTSRINTLREYKILDTPSSPLFDNLVKLAAQISGCPIAIVSLVDKDRQWFKAAFGTEQKQSSIQSSLCGLVLESTSEYLEIQNCLEEPRSCNMPIVKNGVHYYLGFPLIDKNGFKLGSFCVLDSVAHTTPMADSIKSQLAMIRTQAMALIEHHQLNQEIEMSQQRLLESSRASLINDMTKSIAHEINNPLTVLMSSVEIMKQMVKGKDPIINKLLDKMNSNIGSINKVVLAMKDNNVVNNNHFASAQEIISQAFEVVSKKPEMSKVKFVMDMDNFNSSIQVSKSVQQVIYHLVQNAAFAALKNPGMHPVAQMKAKKINETIVISISDSGTGVPEEKIHTLFNGLFHSNYKGEAVGIGLNTCKRIVESLNGSIRFVKNSPTTFEIAIPIKLH